ncbi:uncharacterized protein LOC131553500 isoform X2 [Onychostoma macrolepis]|uniref:uncharacterized protein LOC131553500 isoform X2 n=1 Tax=Onychostoma macrolepis TaxID=369639 RepID=UPI00272CC878|nr:uncharacterized protein LOC131553500 isoform X2 [Onychostoma macrolepis]
MARRCVLGCGSPETLFPIPKIPWLRSRWLGFLHFEDGGISERSRLCSKHFTRECFKNWTQHEMGFVKYLSLTDTAVPSVYTVGSSQSLKPQTRDVACQCDAPYLKSVSLQTIKQKLKRRSKGLFTLPPQNTVEQPAIHLKYTSWKSAFVGGSSLQWSILHTDPQGLSPASNLVALEV